MNREACPSLMELLALRETSEPQTVADHVAGCVRCVARLRDLPALALGDLPDQPQAARGYGGDTRAPLPPPDAIRTGQLWTAASGANDARRELVVVIGRAPGDNMVIAAPTTTALEQAGDSDLILEQSPTGYPHVIELWNHGLVERNQLCEYLGRVDRPVREDLVALYRWLVGAADAPATRTAVGPPITGREDQRLVHRALRQDWLRPLWAAADRRLGAEAHDQPESVPVRTLGHALRDVLAGPEWDEPSLLEASGATAAVLRSMRADQLDLTGRTDVMEVGRVLRVVELDAPLALVKATLEQSGGGLHRAPHELRRIAARSRAGVSQQQRTRDVYRNVGDVDESPEARQKAIDAYLRELEAELEA